MDTQDRANIPSMVRGGGLDIVAKPAGNIRAEEMILNIGPQHPSTHGVLRLILHLSGETVIKAIPVIGYLHRGVEKLSEHLAYDQLAPVYERDDYLAPTANSNAYVIAVERLGAATLDFFGAREGVAVPHQKPGFAFDGMDLDLGGLPAAIASRTTGTGPLALLGR